MDGDRSYPSLTDLPAVPDVAVMVVPPSVTEAAVAECARLGIRSSGCSRARSWKRPSPPVTRHGIAVVSGGPCIMVGLRTIKYQPQTHLTYRSNMEKKSHYHCVDGRKYDITMTWDEKFKDADKVFKIGFAAVTQGRAGR